MRYLLLLILIEGEFIAWRLKEILSDFDSIQRISFNEITKEAVMSAISEPRDVDMDLVNAAIVRRLIDRLVGWRCSKFCKSWKLKSMGGYRPQHLASL